MGGETIEAPLDHALCMCVRDVTAYILELTSNKARDHRLTICGEGSARPGALPLP